MRNRISQSTNDFHISHDLAIAKAIAKIFNLPFNPAARDSGGYDFSDGLRDHRFMVKKIRCEQAQQN